MKTFLLSLVMMQTAFAEPPADAPTAVVLKSGQTVPFNGLLLSDEKAIEAAKRVAGCEAERDELRKSSVTPLVVVLFVASAFVLGGTLGYTIGKTVK